MSCGKQFLMNQVHLSFVVNQNRDHTQQCTCRHITLMLCDGVVSWWAWKVDIYCSEAWLSLVWGDFLFNTLYDWYALGQWGHTLFMGCESSARTKTVSWQCSKREHPWFMMHWKVRDCLDHLGDNLTLNHSTSFLPSRQSPTLSPTAPTPAATL